MDVIMTLSFDVPTFVCGLAIPGLDRSAAR
jgi:hypothetical protein